MRNEDHFHSAAHGHHAGHQDGSSTSDAHDLSALSQEILELLQRHTDELLRTHRVSRGSASGTDAPIIDPWALAGTNDPSGGNRSNGNAAGTLQNLLAMGEKILARLEAPLKNPFEFF